MGRRFDDPMVEQYQKLVPYEITSVGEGDAGAVSHGQRYSASQISAFTLQALKAAAKSLSGREG